jgi:Dienelactone hydrolase family
MSVGTAFPEDKTPPGLTVSRRTYITSAAAAAMGYTLAAGPVRAGAIKTDTEGLSVGAAKVKVQDGEMPAYYAKPIAAQKPPIILVAMEVFGLHEHIKDVTRRLGKLGAFAIAPDYYFRLGELTQITEPSRLMPLVNSKSDQELFADLDAAVAWAKEQGGTRIGSALLVFVAADALFGYMQRVTPLSRRVLPFTAASWIPRVPPRRKTLLILQLRSKRRFLAFMVRRTQASRRIRSRP